MDTKPYSEGGAAGTTRIAPAVLITMARLTSLQVPGVVAMAPVPGGVNRLFRRGASEGVRLEIEDQSVAIDLYLVVANGTNVREVSRNVQALVARAIEDMTGMAVARVDIHIEDIDFAASA
jgi:uncharacterized alkaline shock family protein YloU